MKLQLTIAPELCLRVLKPSEAGKLFVLVNRNRSHLREWLPWLDQTKTIQDTRRFVDMSYRNFLNGGGFNLGIRVEGSLAGVIGFHGFDRVNRVTSIGYWLAEDYTGKGIMARSVARCITYAFEDQAMHRVYIRCASGNVRSRRVAERMGMLHEGTQRQAEWLYDHFVDLEVYSVLSPEWDRSVAHGR